MYSRDMTLTNEDWKSLDKMMKRAVIDGATQALEDVVFPKFEEIDGKFGKIDKRFEQIDKRFEQIDGRFDELEENLGNKIGVLERKLDQVTDHQADKLDDHEKRIGRLENAVLT